MAGQQTRGSRRPTGASGGSDRADARRRLREGNADPATERRRTQRVSDQARARAHAAGRRGDDPAEFQTDDELFGYYQDGQRLAKTERRGARRDQLAGNVRGQAAAGAGKAGSIANDGAGFLLGLFAYALVANFLRNGAAGSRGWLAAKFLNRPMGAASAKPNAPAKPAGPDARAGVKGSV